jgi:outer membrane murein-binding lipoprotein Lpp
VATVEERLAFVEGRVQELSGGYAQLREDIRGLVARVEAMEERLARRMDSGDQQLGGRVDALSSRIDALDQKVDRVREDLSRQLVGLEGRLGTWMRWLVGILVVALVGQIGVLAQAVFR